jgi:multidrug efflux pump subunit AcrA (membrane-fusion protein)
VNRQQKDEKGEMIRLPLAMLLLLLFASACAAPKVEPAKAAQNMEQKVTVATAKAEARDVPTYLQATGSFAAEESSDVASAASGRVASTPVEAGDFVKKGQVICVLESRDAQLRLEQARAGREQAKFQLSQAQSRVGWSGEGNFNPDQVPEVASSLAAYESAQASAKLAAADAQRYANLVKSGDVSQSSYERFKTQLQTAEAAANSARKQYEAQKNTASQNYRAIGAAEASLAAAESQLAQAEKALEDTTVRAPFDGYITARPITVGQWVSNLNKVATLMRISTVRLQLQVPEKYASSVQAGMPVTARIAAYADRDFTGKVSSIVPSVDSSSRTFAVEARFDNPKGDLRPGMFVNAQLMLQGNEPAVFVPAKAVVHDSTTDSDHVYSVANGTARLNVVLKGDSEKEQVRILSGLTGNETVIVDNQASLYDGIAVETR